MNNKGSSQIELWAVELRLLQVYALNRCRARWLPVRGCSVENPLGM